MLSYRNWKLINESALPSFALGIKTPQSMTNFQSPFKETKKRMLLDDPEAKDDMLDVPTDEDDMGDDMDRRYRGDEEEEDYDDFEDMDEIEDDEDLDDEMDDDEDLDDEMGDDEDLDLDDIGDEEEMGDDEDLDDFGMDNMSMKGIEDMNREDSLDRSSMRRKRPMMDEKPSRMFMKKESRDDFIDSLKKQMSGLREDALIPLEDPNMGLADKSDPKPGEVGYAPQGKIGNNFDNNIDSYLDMDQFPSIDDYIEWRTENGAQLNEKYVPPSQTGGSQPTWDSPLGLVKQGASNFGQGIKFLNQSPAAQQMKFNKYNKQSLIPPEQLKAQWQNQDEDNLPGDKMTVYPQRLPHPVPQRDNFPPAPAGGYSGQHQMPLPSPAPQAAPNRPSNQDYRMGKQGMEMTPEAMQRMMARRGPATQRQPTTGYARGPGRNRY